MYSRRKGSRLIERIGSGHDDVGLVLLKTVAWQRMAAGQGDRDLGLDVIAGGRRPVADHGMPCRAPTRSSTSSIPTGTRCSSTLAPITEPTSKLDSLRVLEEVGSRRRHMPRSNVACRPIPEPRAGSGWRHCVPIMSVWDRRHCCSTT